MGVAVVCGLLLGCPEPEIGETGGVDTGTPESPGFPEGASLALASESEQGVGWLRMEGELSGDDLGSDVAGLGDVNGDGWDDLVIGAKGLDEGASDAGAALLLFGPVSEGAVAVSEADAMIQGTSQRMRLGKRLCAAGDLNMDGFADLALAASSPGQEGMVLVFAGPISGTQLADGGVTITGEAEQDEAGDALASAGDVDGDGLPELILGARGADQDGLVSAGSVYIVSGALDGDLSLSAAAARIRGTTQAGALGFSVSTAGDTDGDGLDDVLVGEPNSNRAWLIRGPIAGELAIDDVGIALNGEVNLGQAGYGVALAGDVDGDGRPELLIGDPDRKGEAVGSAWLVSVDGSQDVDLSEARAHFLGEAEGDQAGSRVAGLGDTDGDGLDDFLIGAWFHDGGGTDSGAVYLVTGDVQGTIQLPDESVLITGAEAGDYAAESIAGAGDMDGDGLQDLLVGSVHALEERSAATLVLGRGTP